MSFQRKNLPQSAILSGTQTSSSVSSVLNVSTGIPSLDDILGGGLPLGSILSVLATDPHTTYANLIQRYFIAQGIASGHYMCILDDSAMEITAHCMWTSNPDLVQDSEQKEEGKELGVKIAWRYEHMKPFKTSVSQNESSQDTYCHMFDLTQLIPEHVLELAQSSGYLHTLPISSPTGQNAIDSVLNQLDNKLSNLLSKTPIRLSIPALGSPQWGDMSKPDVMRFLHVLRLCVSRYSSTPRICVLVTLPAYVLHESWIQDLGWLSDGCITLRSFSSDPALLSLFPSHNGLLDIHSLPAPHSLVSPSDKHSQLRGLSTFSSSAAGGGENNLAFKCTRKRFIIETLHLDVEGGVNERRTTAATTSEIIPPRPVEPSTPSVRHVAVNDCIEVVTPEIVKKKKPKKSVAFQHDRPDLYDF
ncbi:Elongator complex protein 4 [Hysterangium stoloniferum]|nr:Elongator complex protein 4 [Hysterangium stoloniferum]